MTVALASLSAPFRRVELEPPGVGPHASAAVAVWYAGLDDAPAGALARHLSAEERDRAARFRQVRDRHRFVARRGLLRRGLADILGVEPARLRLATGRFGKLALAGPEARSGLRFGAAHRDGLAIFAFAAGREIGVDVERLREDGLEPELGARFFSAAERRQLAGVPPRQRARAFFLCWTRKEAYLKATGLGLQRPLADFDVTLRPGEPAALRATRWDPAEAARWSLASLAPAPGWVGALAISSAAAAGDPGHLAPGKEIP